MPTVKKGDSMPFSLAPLVAIETILASCRQPWYAYRQARLIEGNGTHAVSFFVSHMTPHKRARIHKGSCVHCRDGQGQENQEKTGSGATGWSPALATLAEA